jgi:hypothetical protein
LQSLGQLKQSQFDQKRLSLKDKKVPLIKDGIDEALLDCIG